MATESPMRLVENRGVSKWPSPKEAAIFVTSSSSMAAEELGLLLKGQRLRVHGREMVPHRSGSAPPSMEGSFAAIGNLIACQNSNMDPSLANLNNAIQNCESEEQLRADPAYLEYYCSNVNLNPRLPPPLISRENRRLVRHIGGFGSNWKSTSFDDSSNGSLHLSEGTLSTHKEEPEDDKSPRQTSGNWAEDSSLFPGQSASLAGRHKSLVDLIQEDFPRTPSPVYNLQRSSNIASVQETVDQDVLGNSVHDSSMGTAKLAELNVASGGISVGTPTSHVHGVGLILNSDTSAAPIPRSSTPDGTGASLVGRKGNSSSVDTHLEDDVLITGLAADSDITSIESRMKGLNISGLHDNRNEQSSMQQHHLHRQQGSIYNVQEAQSHIVSQEINRSYNGLDQFNHSHGKFSSVEMQPVLQTSGITPPLYATTTAYMASGSPFYPNLQPSGLFAPQYNVGGYALNTALMPPVLTGYSPHSAVPMAFDTISGPSFNTRTAGLSTGLGPGVDLQQPYKIYGHLGLAVQPSYTDSVYLQYFQHPTDPYGVSNQYDNSGGIRGLIGSQGEAFNSQKRSPTAAYTAEYQRSTGLSTANPRKVGITSPSYYGSPPNVGVMMQFPTSPLASPVIPGSPMGGMSPAGRRNELKFQPGTSKNTGSYSGWQGQRGTDRFDDSKICSFLEELKSSKARKFELSDIAGRIIEFSGDQHGSRFIQQKLENCNAQEKASVFKEVLPHASKLMTDVFGNYVIQKFFEHGGPEQRKELADQLSGHILPLSLQMYGCRVIQKALEVIELDQKTRLVHELDGHVMKCVRDQNGNHVIQKCIECVPTEKICFIISAFRGQVATLSTHPYGCRVIQRVLEYCSDERQSQCIVDEILESACALAEDQYGNYVTQHVLERGKPHERSQIISKLAGNVVQLSQHKFASNVVEKCLEHGDAAERELLIEEIVGQTEGNDNLLTMMKDQFANYVVQKILELCSDKQREILLSRIRVNLQALRKYTYGKHIVVRFEQLCGEEINAFES